MSLPGNLERYARAMLNVEVIRVKVYRSYLFTPGSDGRKMEKALASEADAVILDLEDAVAPSEKEAARNRIRDLLQELTASEVSKTPDLFVRVNSVQSPWGLNDLRATYSPLLAGVMVSKVESHEELAQVERILEELLVDGHDLEVLPFIESARAVRYLGEVVEGTRRVRRVCFGGVDFALDVGASFKPEDLGLLYARSMLVVESRIAGLDAPVDTVYPDFGDVEALRQDALQARKLGFLGKLVIHPRQVPPVNEVFTPSDEEVERARQIVAAYEAAVREGAGASKVGGQMVELPIAERARRVLALAASLAPRR